MIRESSAAFGDLMARQQPSLTSLLLQVWFPVGLLAFTTLGFFLVLSVRRLRNLARWRLPGFYEASLSQLASTLAMMLKNGADLGSAIEVAQTNEAAAGAKAELAHWRQRLAGGARKFADIARPGKLTSPLFVWLVTRAGENWAEGFRRAAEVYDGRAKYRIDLVLYAALPVSILLVAGIVFPEMLPLVKGFTQLLGRFNDVGGE